MKLPKRVSSSTFEVSNKVATVVHTVAPNYNSKKTEKNVIIALFVIGSCDDYLFR
jgi:hypothetical protein